jgi:hypothetical protein
MQQFNAVDAQTQAKWRNPSKMATIERGETKRVLCVCFATKQFMSLQNSSKQFMSVYVLSMGPHCSLHHCSLHQVTKHLRVKKLPRAPVESVGWGRLGACERRRACHDAVHHTSDCGRVDGRSRGVRGVRIHELEQVAGTGPGDIVLVKGL